MNRNTYLVLKKAVNLILLLVFFLTLTACAGKDTNDGKAADKEDTKQENAVQPEKEESDAAENDNNEVKNNALDEFEVYGKFAEFTTNDIDGNEVTQSIFANKDLTVVNIWGTFCGPCINEMPELGAWEKELPDNVQIVGLIVDISSTDDETQIAAAKQITEKADAGFVNLIGGNGAFDELIGSIVGVPTTIFVDKSGNIVGEIIVGADVDRYKSFVNKYVEALNNSSQKQAE